MKNCELMWSIWAKSLGQKASDDVKTADIVAIIRTIMFFMVFLTNMVIVAGVIRHW